MPWHLSKSDPRKVYDERHITVCVCDTAERAAFIIDAANEKREWERAGESIRLREPQSTIMRDVKINIPMPDGVAIPAELLRTFEPDKCCGRLIANDAVNGRLLKAWTCPKCGMEWKPRAVAGVEHWSPAPAVMVFSPAR